MREGAAAHGVRSTHQVLRGAGIGRLGSVVGGRAMVIGLGSIDPPLPADGLPVSLHGLAASSLEGLPAGALGQVAAAPGAELAPRVSLLRRVIVVTDAVAISSSWAAVTTMMRPWTTAGAGIQILRICAVTVAGLVMLATGRLYRARVARIRSVELVRLVRVAVVTGLVAYLTGLVGRGHRREAVIGATTCYVFLAVARRVYSGWLAAGRRRGRWLQPVVIVGGDSDAVVIATLLQERQHACLVCGFVADAPPELPAGLDIPFLGRPADTLAVVRASGATGVIMSTAGVDPVVRNRLLRELTAAGVYVQLSTGLSGISYRRLRPQPLAHQPFFGVEPVDLGRAQMSVKRLVDLTLGPLMLLVGVPLLLAGAIAVKLCDGGPVLFRQQRIGRHGKAFTLFKLRTMSVDAESRLAGLASMNERRGPLFKLDADPRVTRVGRVLRATSIDELPQLFNVILGEMTLVGPRPALAAEVEQFDEELLGRHRMTPGITGMWQLEARDDPSFESYRLFDMFYVENWSLTLDVAIIFGTAVSVVSRSLRQLGRSVGRRRKVDVDDPSVVIDICAEPGPEPGDGRVGAARELA